MVQGLATLIIDLVHTLGALLGAVPTLVGVAAGYGLRGWWLNSVGQGHKEDDPPRFRNGLIDALAQLALLTLAYLALNETFSLLATFFGPHIQLGWWLAAASSCGAWLVMRSLHDWLARRWNRGQQTERRTLLEGITVDARYTIDGESYTVTRTTSDYVYFISDADTDRRMYMTKADILATFRKGKFLPLDHDNTLLGGERRNTRWSWRGVPRWGGRVALLVVAAVLFAGRADSFDAATLVIFAVAWAMFELRALWRYRGADAARSTAMNAFHWPGHPWLGRVIDWALLGTAMLLVFVCSFVLSVVTGLLGDTLSWADTMAVVLALVFGILVHDGAALLWNRDRSTDTPVRRDEDTARA